MKLTNMLCAPVSCDFGVRDWLVIHLQTKRKIPAIYLFVRLAAGAQVLKKAQKIDKSRISKN